MGDTAPPRHLQEGDEEDTEKGDLGDDIERLNMSLTTLCVNNDTVSDRWRYTLDVSVMPSVSYKSISISALLMMNT